MIEVKLYKPTPISLASLKNTAFSKVIITRLLKEKKKSLFLFLLF